MKRRALLLAFGLFGGAHTATGEPCVSATFDTPLTGAVNVITRQVDVPSPQFPGVWQEGNLDGYFYALYANGEAVVKDASNPPEWDVRITCPTDREECKATANGTPPQAAQNIVLILQQCLKGVDQQALEPTLEEPTAPCGVAAVPDGTPIFVLQSLLAVAGADPGPADGLMGAKTRNALIEILGASGGGAEVSAAIAALDRLLCDVPD